MARAIEASCCQRAVCSGVRVGAGLVWGEGAVGLERDEVGEDGGVVGGSDLSELLEGGVMFIRRDAFGEEGEESVATGGGSPGVVVGR